jgi:hypothetical protein
MERVGKRANGVPLAHHRLKLRAIAQRDHRTDGITVHLCGAAADQQDPPRRDAQLIPDGTILREQPGKVCAEEQVVHGCALAARGQPQQTAGLVIGQHQLARLVGDDQPLTHGAQHRLVMLVLAGNDRVLQTEGLPVYPIRDEQRPGDSHRERDLGQRDEAKQLLLIPRCGAVRAAVEPHHRLDADGEHDDTDLQHDQLSCQAPPTRVHTRHHRSHRRTLVVPLPQCPLRPQ